MPKARAWAQGPRPMGPGPGLRAPARPHLPLPARGPGPGPMGPGPWAQAHASGIYMGGIGRVLGDIGGVWGGILGFSYEECPSGYVRMSFRYVREGICGGMCGNRIRNERN